MDDTIQMVSCGCGKGDATGRVLAVTALGTAMCSQCGSHMTLEDIIKRLNEGSVPRANETLQ